MGSLLTQTPASELWATLEVLHRLGMTPDRWRRLRVEPGYAQQVLGPMLRDENNGIPPGFAEELLGRYGFFGVGGWNKAFGECFPDKPQTLEGLKEQKITESFPWNDGVLNSTCPFHPDKRVRDTHFGFLGLRTLHGNPLTILQWCNVSVGSPTVMYPSDKLEGYDFIKRKRCKFRWYLSLREPVPHSQSKTWDEQVALLPENYEAPSAVCELTKQVLYYRSTNRCPYTPNDQNWNGYGLRCRDEIRLGQQRRFATITVNKRSGTYLETTAHDWRGTVIMLPATRKLPTQFQDEQL
jgi:hypothetical protein